MFAKRLPKVGTEEIQQPLSSFHREYLVSNIFALSLFASKGTTPLHAEVFTAECPNQGRNLWTAPLFIVQTFHIDATIGYLESSATSVKNFHLNVGLLGTTHPHF